MKNIFNYLREYFIGINKKVLATASIFIGILIFVNYYYGLNEQISRLSERNQFFSWYFVFLLSFAFGYFLQVIFTRSPIYRNPKFIALLLIAPAIFSWKMMFTFHFDFADDVFKNEYWNDVVYWPLKIAGVVMMLLVVHYIFDRGRPFYGITTREFKVRPYLIMLLIMVPLVAAASTQPDFLAMYPKMQWVEYLMQPGRGLHKLLYELSYGSDFFTIELFFRGFLILAFAKWVGKDAVLPMALFYCTIHFGKPLGECISSYFGGMILGVVILNNRTIFGGLLVHVGIAWMMELGGYIGNLFSSP